MPTLLIAMSIYQLHQRLYTIFHKLKNWRAITRIFMSRIKPGTVTTCQLSFICITCKPVKRPKGNNITSLAATCTQSIISIKPSYVLSFVGNVTIHCYFGCVTYSKFQWTRSNQWQNSNGTHTLDKFICWKY